MKMLKKMIIPVLLVAMLAACLLLTSCKQTCDHEYGEWTVTKEVGCTENGEMARTCALCGNVETSVTASTGHEVGGLVCGKCDKELVGIDSLFPTVSDDVKSVGIVLSDVLLSNVFDDQQLTLKLAELVFYLDEDGTPAVYGAGEAKLDETETASYLAFSEGDKLYVEFTAADVGTRYIEASVSGILLSNPEVSDALESTSTLLPALEQWLNESLLPVFTTPDLPTEIPELTEEKARLAVAKVIDLFFDVKSTDSGAVITLDLSLVKDVNNALNEMTVAELIDSIGGEGSFLKLEAMIPTVLNFSGDDLVKFLSLNLGMDIPAFFDALDELAVIVTGEDGVSFEMLLGIELDIEEILENEEFLATSVKDLLIESIGLTTEEELNAVIGEIILALESNTIYQIFEVDPDIPAQINSAVDMITEAVKLEISLDKDGKFAGTKLTVDLPEQHMLATVTVNVEGEIEINLNDGEGTNNISLGIYPGYEVNKDAERMAALKAKLTELPDINEKILDADSYFPVGVVVDGVLVSAVYVRSAYFETIDGVNYLIVMLEEVDVASPVARMIDGNCGDKTAYSYHLVSVEEYRYYAVDEATATDPDADPTSIAYRLISSNEEYTSEDKHTNIYPLTFCYDKSGEAYPSYEFHSFEIDYENSVSEEDVSCGETYRVVYKCTGCGTEEIEADVKSHNTNVTEITYDEELALVYGKAYCVCGQLLANHTFSILKNEVNIRPIESEEESMYIDFSFTITEAGNYRIYVHDASTEESGYSHIYMNTYLGTLYFGSYQTGYIDLYLTAGEGYFTILNYFPETSLDISVGIERIN